MYLFVDSTHRNDRPENPLVCQKSAHSNQIIRHVWTTSIIIIKRPSNISSISSSIHRIIKTIISQWIVIPIAISKFHQPSTRPTVRRTIISSNRTKIYLYLLHRLTITTLSPSYERHWCNQWNRMTSKMASNSNEILLL